MNRQQYDHTEDLVDHYWGSINYISGMIRSSEIKAGLILSFYGIVLNLIFLSYGKKIPNMFDDVLLGIFIIIGLMFMTISIYFSIRCFMPRLETKYEKNIFFFGDVVNSFGTIKEFSKTFYQISNDGERLFDQLGQQVYVNAKIAGIKFKFVNKSLFFLAMFFIALSVTVFYALLYSLAFN